LVPNLCWCVFLSCFIFVSFYPPTSFFFTIICMTCMNWISTKPCITHMEGINAYVYKYTYKYTYICICYSLIIVKTHTLLSCW
jgi:hypothetical protein